MLCLGQEVRKDTLVEFGLANLPALKQGLAAGVEGAVQQSKEGQRLGGEDLALSVVDRAEDVDALQDNLGSGHFGCVCDLGIKKKKRITRRVTMEWT